MTLDAIKEAISQLPPDQQSVLARWLAERDWEAWDEQIERDFAPKGRGSSLLSKLESEIGAGGSQLLEQGFAERRKTRE